MAFGPVGTQPPPPAATKKGRKGVGHWIVGDVERHQVSLWEAALRREGLADSTISIQRALLHRVYEYLIDEEMFTGTNPFRATKRRKKDKKKLVREPHILRLDEIVALTLGCQPYYGLLLETQFWSGARSGETRALDGASIDLGQEELRIRQALTAENSNQPSSVPRRPAQVSVLPPRLAEFSRRSMHEQSPSGVRRGCRSSSVSGRRRCSLRTTWALSSAPDVARQVSWGIRLGGTR